MTSLSLRADAYTPDALVEAGVPAAVARTLVVEPKRRGVMPMRARTSLRTRQRTVEPTLHYVWGPDAMTLLASQAERAGA